MRLKLLFALTFTFWSLYSFCQNDTSYQYFNNNWKSSPKDSAFYYSQILPLNYLWVRKDFVAKTGSPYMRGTFTDKELKTRQGLFTWYYEGGKLKDSVLFENGKRTASWHFYENGNKKAIVSYSNGKVVAQEGWDESGKEIPDFVFEKGAEFPGGMQGWKRYLETHLNANAPANDRAPNGVYTVKVEFMVDKEGKVNNVRAISVPRECPSCGIEAVRVINKGPNWVPATQFGRTVIYQAVQFISFMVSNG